MNIMQNQDPTTIKMRTRNQTRFDKSYIAIHCQFSSWEVESTMSDLMSLELNDIVEYRSLVTKIIALKRRQVKQQTHLPTYLQVSHKRKLLHNICTPITKRIKMCSPMTIPDVIIPRIESPVYIQFRIPKERSSTTILRTRKVKKSRKSKKPSSKPYQPGCKTLSEFTSSDHPSEYKDWADNDEVKERCRVRREKALKIQARRDARDIKRKLKRKRIARKARLDARAAAVLEQARIRQIEANITERDQNYRHQRNIGGDFLTCSITGSMGG